MTKITLQLPSDIAAAPKEEISKLLDAEIDQFSEYMSSIGDWKTAGPLLPQERALIKTYLVQKVKGTF